MSIQELPVSILNLKAAFDTGISRPLGWRRKQIEGIHDLVQKNSESLVSAALKDDRLTRTEVLLELTSILRAADKSVEELVNYDKSKDTFTNASTGLLETHRTRIASRSNPSGMILVQSHWAYPYSSILNNMIASFASGNLCLLLATSPAVSATLSSLLPIFLDHSAFAILDPVDITKSTMHLISSPSSPPSLSNLSISLSGGLTVVESASPPSAPSVAYIHETGDVHAAGNALVYAKSAFNAQSPFAPTIAFIDDAVYEGVCASVKRTLRDLAGRQSVQGADKILGDINRLINSGDVKVLSNGPLWVLEASNKTTFSVHGHSPFLILSRVSSPDTAVDKIKLLPAVSAFYIYAAEPFRSYVVNDVDSIVTVVNDIPLDMLVNPFETPFSSSTTKIFTRPQQVVIASKPSKIPVGNSALSIRLEKKILKSHITRFDEGDGTRWDFFQRVKMVFVGVKYLGYATALTGAFLVYRKYSR